MSTLPKGWQYKEFCQILRGDDMIFVKNFTPADFTQFQLVNPLTYWLIGPKSSHSFCLQCIYILLDFWIKEWGAQSCSYWSIASIAFATQTANAATLLLSWFHLLPTIGLCKEKARRSLTFNLNFKRPLVPGRFHSFWHPINVVTVLLNHSQQ